MSEAIMNKKVADWLKTVPNGFGKKRHAGPGQKGEPDVTGAIGGLRVELEGKLPGNKPTPKQAQWLDIWTATGAVTGVFYSLEEAKEIIYRRFPELRPSAVVEKEGKRKMRLAA